MLVHWVEMKYLSAIQNQCWQYFCQCDNALSQYMPAFVLAVVTWWPELETLLLKKATTIREHIARNNTTSNREGIPKWMTLAKTFPCQKDPSKGNAVDNYRTILCLSLMWKLMTKTIAESIYNFCDVNDKLPVEQKGCREKSRGTIDKMILRGCRKRHANLGMYNI